MFFRFSFVLVAVVLVVGSPLSAHGAPPMATEEQLTERAAVIVTGAVRRIYTSHEGSRTLHVAEVTVESCAKGGYEESDVLRVHYHEIAGAPFTAGSSGHTFVPRVGQRIDVFTRERDGAHEAVFPNGMREAEPLVFIQVHDAAAYDTIIAECLRLDRYLLGLDFATRRLGIAWDRDAARALFRFSVRTGASEWALLAFTDRLRAHPDDMDARGLATMLAWELRDDRDVFGRVLEFGRNNRHAGVIALLAMHLDWEGADGAFALYKEAMDLDPDLGDERLARTVYPHAIDAARDAGEDRTKAKWLAMARERFPEDEMNWAIRDK